MAATAASKVAEATATAEAAAARSAVAMAHTARHSRRNRTQRGRCHTQRLTLHRRNCRRS